MSSIVRPAAASVARSRVPSRGLPMVRGGIAVAGTLSSSFSSSSLSPPSSSSSSSFTYLRRCRPRPSSSSSYSTDASPRLVDSPRCRPPTTSFHVGSSVAFGVRVGTGRGVDASAPSSSSAAVVAARWMGMSKTKRKKNNIKNNNKKKGRKKDKDKAQSQSQTPPRNTRGVRSTKHHRENDEASSMAQQRRGRGSGAETSTKNKTHKKNRAAVDVPPVHLVRTASPHAYVAAGAVAALGVDPMTLFASAVAPAEDEDGCESGDVVDANAGDDDGNDDDGDDHAVEEDDVLDRDDDVVGGPSSLSPRPSASRATSSSSSAVPRRCYPPSFRFASFEHVPFFFGGGNGGGNDELFEPPSPSARSSLRGGGGGMDPADADGVPEVAFLGRSNVGKSSLINALTGKRKQLARVSKTPGRTQRPNYFAVVPTTTKRKMNNKMKESQETSRPTLYLVDLPGYGYAAAPDANVSSWQEQTQDILIRRRNAGTLRRLFLLVDARVGVTSFDSTIMGWFDEAEIPYTVVLTKVDKAGKPAVVRLANELCLRYHGQLFGDDGGSGYMGPVVHATSARDGTGMRELMWSIDGELRMDEVVEWEGEEGEEMEFDDDDLYEDDYREER